jgi:hypothetical protein
MVNVRFARYMSPSRMLVPTTANYHCLQDRTTYVTSLSDTRSSAGKSKLGLVANAHVRSLHTRFCSPVRGTAFPRMPAADGKGFSEGSLRLCYSRQKR